MPLIPSTVPVAHVADALGSRRAAPLTAAAAARGTAAAQVSPLHRRPERGGDRGGLLPLHRILHARRATRAFAPQPLTREQVLRCAGTAHAAMDVQWPGEDQAAAGLTLLLGAYDVIDVPRGLYAVRARDSVPLAPVGEPETPAGFEQEYVAAPAHLYVCGRIGDGEHQGVDYGALLVLAGSLGYSGWLAAVGQGLSGCAFGRSCERVTAAARTVDPALRHLFTVAVGHPGARPPAEPGTARPSHDLPRSQDAGADR